MKKIVLFIFLFLIFSNVKEVAEARAQPNADSSNVSVVLLQNKIEILEQKINTVDQDIDRILQSSQSIWGSILTAVLSIMALLLGGSIFNTFFYVRLRINENKESLRNEIAEKLKEIRREFKDNVDEKLNKLQDKYVTKFDMLEAAAYDAIGRVYQDKLPEVAAIWFARCVEKHMASDQDKGPDQWLVIRMGWVVECLTKASRLDNPSYIAEFHEIISKVDEKKYKAQKEEMKKALEENLVRKEETKTVGLSGPFS